MNRSTRRKTRRSEARNGSLAHRNRYQEIFSQRDAELGQRRSRIQYAENIPLLLFKPADPSNIQEQVSRIGEAVLDGLWKGVKFAASYNMNLAVNTLHYLRQPLAIFMCFYVLIFMTGYISQTVYRAFSPMCAIPGLSGLSVCQFQVAKRDLSAVTSLKMTPKLADYLTLMNMQSKSFEILLQESAGGSRLSLEIKMAEMATSDLLARVRVSNLSTRGGLAASLSGFISDAKKTARGLQRLSSKIGGAVDK